MRHQRFHRGQVSGEMNETDYIMVPGVELFKRDYLNTYLSQLNDVNLSINLSLLLNKYPWWFRESNGMLRLDKDFGKLRLNRPPQKVTHHYNEEMLKSIAEFSSKPPANYSQIRDRHYSVPDEFTAQSILLTTKTRLIVGLSGSASVFETSITLHPYYGFPIIPGSAIKGVTRHFCEEYKNGEIDSDTIRRLFGNKPGAEDSYEGDIVFYDAWPEEWQTFSGNPKPMLELDIINPHYKDYYRENSHVYPADNQDPNPIKFLVVRKGIKFRFQVRPSAKCNDSSLISLAISLIKEALTTVGIGAKTGSSYGYFRR